VSAIDGVAVQKLLSAAPKVRLMDLRRADAYVRRLPYLHKLVLPEGVIDLKRGIPPQEVTMVALSANLVAREQIHPVAVELLLIAARQVHGGPTLLHPAGVFPAPKDLDLPLSQDADRFYKERPSLLRRLLPFWVAVWLERTLFIALPLIAIDSVFAYLPKIRLAHPFAAATAGIRSLRASNSMPPRRAPMWRHSVRGSTRSMRGCMH
jgi:hypothetical protein